MVIIVDWTLIVFPVIAVVVVSFVVILIVYLHWSRDGYVYTIIDL